MNEFEYNDKDFAKVKKIIGEHAGINLCESKRSLVYNRLTKRLRHLKLNKFSDYLDFVDTHIEEEFSNFVNAITTNLTFFFREEHHFKFLLDSEFERIMEKNKATKKVRIWSAGCSTGEEPYSIAIAVKEKFPEDWDVKILATDLDFNVVAHGKAGIYKEKSLEGVSTKRKKVWFKHGSGENAGNVKVSPELQQLITFKQLNLMKDWPIKGPLDLIFCRNVMIYFNKETQKKLAQRYAAILADDAHLIIGHSESLLKISTDFQLIEKTVYKKVTQ
ncbi:MAG: protein-glutamate O-methyltransferase [Thiotrichales bacterium]|jgi:chemotaxis protein methyltransferase CheR|nr:protein-glutamate O-methyltransferase [Thiotrichales bacterium]MBT3614066.1 protein-glutamate O-methyltransferase [Thiotrichales bacterium]MBT4260875.1 protein-glutamate O-methyltransferase [Thiotrichales bacterium]MBT5290533.1 protein-glutamate O-methyltransferase [Thiotrichales bacterium]MBT5417822.1 protein-glutamate O-methyltransferase [Thiotrichales bacterium]